MPSCSQCGSDMVIHEDGLSSTVWKCSVSSYHPTTTLDSGFKTAMTIGGWAVTVIGLCFGIFLPPPNSGGGGSA